MTAAAQAIHAGIPEEPNRLGDGVPRPGAIVLLASVGSKHVPRWVADDGIEAAVSTPAAVSVKEHLWKRELPVECAFRPCDAPRMLSSGAA